MEKTTQSLKFLQKRKFLLVLPLLVLPFITLLFWALGGGKGGEVSAQQKQERGLNPELPKANTKDAFQSKFSFYEKADKDSAKYREQSKGDPYYRKENLEAEEQSYIPSYDPLPPQQSANKAVPYGDPNEEKVYRKLAQLNEQLNTQSQQSPITGVKKEKKVSNAGSPAVKSEDIDRLENMMRMMKEGNGEDDPEMTQLNQLLEKILDVQHPERVQERNKAKAELTKRATARKMNGLKDQFASMTSTSTGFFGAGKPDTTVQQSAITAAVNENQVMVSGAVVKLRLSEDMKIKGQSIPKGQLVYGVADLNNERLTIEISSIRYGNAIYPVKLEVYDLDGMEGIYVPGAISRDVAKQSANNAVQSIELMSMDPSLPAQAATAGVNAAKSLLTKKAKQVKVTLKAGYQVLLKEQEVKQ